MNEFRQTLSDQTASFPNRVELQALAQRVTDLATRMDKNEGAKTGVTDGTKLLLAFGGLFFTAVSVALAVFLALK